MKGFIKKNWQKDAGQVAVGAATRLGGALGAAWVANKFLKEDGTNTKTTLHNIGGPLMVAVGVLGDMMFENKMAKDLCQGVTTYAAIYSLAAISPNVKEMATLGDIEDDAAMFNGTGVGAIGETTTAPAIEMGATDNELPEEFKEVTVTENDGNDWNAVADDIEEGAEDAIQVSGAEYEDEPTPEQMMGML